MTLMDGFVLSTGWQISASPGTSRAAVFHHLLASLAASMLWMVILPPQQLRATLVLLKAPKHLQLCTVPLLGCWSVQILPAATGTLLSDSTKLHVWG